MRIDDIRTQKKCIRFHTSKVIKNDLTPKSSKRSLYLSSQHGKSFSNALLFPSVSEERVPQLRRHLSSSGRTKLLGGREGERREEMVYLENQRRRKVQKQQRLTRLRRVQRDCNAEWRKTCCCVKKAALILLHLHSPVTYTPPPGSPYLITSG